jgi:hypothetical protein
MTHAEQAAAKCAELLPLTPEARKAFADRQAKLIDWGTRIDDRGEFIGKKPWPCHGWYNDEDFCRAYNTACAMADDAKRLRTERDRLAAMLDIATREAVKWWFAWRSENNCGNLDAHEGYKQVAADIQRRYVAADATKEER